MSETKTIFVTKKFIADDYSDAVHSEIDFIFQEKFGFDYDDEDMEFEMLSVGQGNADGFPVEIDAVIEALIKLKNLGSTHVEMDYHCDHIGYQISGYEIKKSAQDEIDIFLNKKLSLQNKNKKIQELYNQISKIKNNVE